MSLVEKPMSVYSIVFPNGKRYIGVTSVGIEKRISDHISASKSKDTKLYRAIRKYGISNLEVEYLGQVQSKDEAVSVEKAFIEMYDSRKNGYNSTDGGEGVKGYVFTEADRITISESQKRRYENPKEVERARNRFMNWRSRNPEQVSQMNSNRRESVQKESHRMMMSDKMKSVYNSDPKYRERNSRSKIKFFEENPEAKVSISRSLGGTPIKVFKDGVHIATFDTLMECGRSLNLSTGNIGSVLRGKRNHTHGYTFERVKK